MKITFCDRCAAPIKGKKFRIIIYEYIEELQTNFDPEADEPAVSPQRRFVQQKEIEICETCKVLIEDILKQRMEGIIKLASDLKTIYSIPSKEPKIEKSDKKKKKTE